MKQPGPCPWCCWCCWKLIFTGGPIALSLLLIIYTSSPICSIEQFDAFSLNKTANSSTTTNTNHTLSYNLKLRNTIVNKGVYYDALKLTFYYKPNLTSYPIGNISHPAFYQGYYKTAHRKGSFDATPGVNWENANGYAVFRVELATAVRYKAALWKSKRHRLVVAADLQVDEEGRLVKRKKNKGIKLSSGAANEIKDCFDLVGILGILAFIHF